ncbi:peptide-methionine (R)-S-oxide reductase [Sphingobium subterraneum]|uniref:peptide-methionine (R)-S-oxide reductase n=1 Tax=Sphingobium subterraneum TaxID=627688 RepID=UPI001C847A0E
MRRIRNGRVCCSSSRRTFAKLCITGAVGAAVWPTPGIGSDAAAATSAPVKLTDAEWRTRLSAQAYAVLRKASTEQPFTSPLSKEHRKGRFVCTSRHFTRLRLCFEHCYPH